MKKIITIFLISFCLLWTQFSQAETNEANTTEEKEFWPEILDMKTIFTNWKWELFINWAHFWDDSKNIEVLLIDNYWEEDEESSSLSIAWIYENLIVINIKEWMKNWVLMIKKKSTKKDLDWKFVYFESNKQIVDFWLPEIKKVEAPKWIRWWKYITIEWYNFNKPTYWTIWSKEYICAKEDENSCKFRLPEDEQVSWNIWIKSLGFTDETSGHSIKIFKQPKFEMLWYSETTFNFDIQNYSFKDLRQIPTTESEVNMKIVPTKKNWYESWKKWVFLMVNNSDWGFTTVEDCTISSMQKMDCVLDNTAIPYQWMWHLDFFWSKSALFDYSMNITQPKSLSYKIKWTNYKEWNETIEWNIIILEVLTEWMDILKREWIEFMLDWASYTHESANLEISKNKITLKLKEIPSTKKWEIYIIQHWLYENEKWEVVPRAWWVKSKNIWYDFWEFIPEVNKVYSTEDDDVYVIEWKNLTNFNDQATSVKFWKWRLTENIINSETLDSDEFSEIDNWLAEGFESRILRKSNERIELKVFYPDEYWKSIEKWEHTVSVTANWITSNSMDFYFDPKEEENITYAPPEIQHLEFLNWAWDPELLKINWERFEKVQEVFFSDEKIEIVEKNNNEITVKVPNSIFWQWPITMKLSDWSLTNTLFIYKFISNKENKIYVEWTKDEEWKKLEVNIRNYYKEIVLKDIRFSLVDKESNAKFAFYNINSNWLLSVDWRINQDKHTVEFENNNFDQTIDIMENLNEKKSIQINFETTQSGYWEYELKIEDINFYDANNIPNKIPSSVIIIDKDSHFYTVEDENADFCIKKDLDWKFKNCDEVVWELEDDGFSQNAIKSDFISPIKEVEKINTFYDIWEDAWYRSYVENLYQRSVINWYADWSFKAWNEISRAEAVKMLLLSRSEKLKDLYYSKFAFEDVPETHWAKNILEYAVRNHFLTASKSFYPNKAINRAEASKLITRFFWRKVTSTKKETFQDTKWHWAKSHIEYLYENWIVSWAWNWKFFNPDNKVTRAEFSKMISNSIDLWSK